MYSKNCHGRKIRQKREGLAKGMEKVNSAISEEVTEIITEKTTLEPRLKGGEESAIQITGE